MALSLRNPDTEKLVRRFAALRGIGMTEAIQIAVSAALANEMAVREAEIERKRKAIQDCVEAFAKLPVIDPTVNADDWMYDENGLPH